RLQQRFTVVERLQLGQLLDMLLHQIGDLPEKPRAVGTVHLRIRAFLEGTARGRDRTVDILATGRGDPGDHLPRSGVDRIERFTGYRIDPPAADKHPPVTKETVVAE